MRPFSPFIFPLRRKVFISYHHKDEFYKNLFEELFWDVFINKSVKFGGIDSDLTERYIKRLIQEGHISDSSVCVIQSDLKHIAKSTWIGRFQQR